MEIHEESHRGVSCNTNQLQCFEDDEAKRQLGRELNEAKLINLFYVPCSDKAKEFCVKMGVITEGWRLYNAQYRNNETFRKRSEKGMRPVHAASAALVSALVVSGLQYPKQWLSCSLNSNDYNNPKRYQNRSFRFTQFKGVFDALSSRDLGLIEFRPGYLDDQGNGRVTRIRATPELLDRARNYGITKDTLGYHFTRSENEEVIIQRKDKHCTDVSLPKLVIYDDDEQSMVMRNQVLAINHHISGTSIGLNIGVSYGLSNELLMHTLPITNCIKDHKSLPVVLKRIFNNSSFSDGGRLYHGWWQQLKKEQRQHIVIDGLPTVELDYDQMHPTILYAKHDIPLPSGDLYEIEGLDRKVAKKLFNAMLNHDKRFTRTWPDDVEKPEGWSLSDAQDAILAKHKQIASDFFTGVGLKLQRKDSDLMVELLLSLQDKNIAALPIHDSIIVQQRHMSTAKEVMEKLFEVHMGTTCAVSASVSPRALKLN